MRPVRKPDLSNEVAAPAAAGHLLDALGAYCAFCEVPLLAELWVLDGRTGRITWGDDPASGWSGLLLLCHNCREAHERNASADLGRMLLPDRDLTFRSGGGSPFIYTLEPVRVVLLGDEGEPLGEPQETERVLVRATDPRAQATLDHFTLNTRYYDADTATFHIPRSDALSLVDRRVGLRTEAWRLAEKLADRFKTASTVDIADGVLVFADVTASATGFWSVWVTVFRRELGEEGREILGRLFLPTMRSPSGFHNPFPGTVAEAIA